MKQKMIFFISLLLITNSLLFGQVLSERLGGIKTNFRFISDTVDLKVNNQFIIKSAEKFCDWDSRENSSFGYGYGYESYHLEFSTNKYLSVKYDKKPDCQFELTFYDKENNVIATKEYWTSLNKYNSNYMTKVTIEGSADVRFFSFDLLYLPISVLDKTTKIEVLKIIDIKEKVK